MWSRGIQGLLVTVRTRAPGVIDLMIFMKFYFESDLLSCTSEFIFRTSVLPTFTYFLEYQYREIAGLVCTLCEDWQGLQPGRYQ